MLPPDYHIRLMQATDFDPIIAICRKVYPSDVPYTRDELEAHHRAFPQGQFVAVRTSQDVVAGAHFTLRLRLADFSIDDPWDVLTAKGTFADHNPVTGHTLYCADIMVDPEHQHHGIAHALTDVTRDLVRQEGLWRTVAASRLPGYGKIRTLMDPGAYVKAVICGELSDPVLTVHLKDGWSPVKPIHGYLAHDEESDGWAEVIQWINPESPPPPEMAIRSGT